MSNLGSMLDRFFIVHLLGFFVMSFSIRNATLTWMVSVGFELMELSLKNWFTNFNECWYDSLILDVLVCNNIGIALGILLSTYLLENRGWSWLKPLEREPWMHTCIVTSTMFSILNAFVLKAVLFIPAEHPINPLRTMLMGLELYYFVLEGTEKTNGSMFKFGCITLVLEMAVGYRHGVRGGLLDLDVLPFGGKIYLFLLLIALVVSAVKVANYSRKRRKEE